MAVTSMRMVVERHRLARSPQGRKEGRHIFVWSEWRKESRWALQDPGAHLGLLTEQTYPGKTENQGHLGLGIRRGN